MAASTTVLKIPGREDPTARLGERVQLAGGAVTVTPRVAVEVEATRGGGLVEIPDVAPDTVLEMELQGGIRLWTSPALMAEDLRPAAAARGGDAGAPGDLVVPTSWRVGSRTRGAGALTLRALKLLDVDLAKNTASGLAAWIEARSGLEPGLYPWDEAGAFGTPVSAQQPLESSEPMLVFLHGTGSCTRDSFHDLLATPSWARLHKRYRGRVYAFEHRTLSESPIANALALARLLAAGSRLHLVSHSRGGLVGELLCRAGRIGSTQPFDPNDLRLVAGADSPAGLDRSADQQALAALGEELVRRHPSIERFVRVACPARGTTLASGRLDRFFSLTLNLLDAVPGLRASVTYDTLKALLLGVVKMRTDPAVLPGLEAMMPSSPLVRMLNRRDVHTSDSLAVIAGDIQGEGFFGRLSVLATDLFYREDHDLVVNTRAMFGGAQRAAGFSLSDRGPAVNHFRYFANERTVGGLENALLEADLARGGFEPLVRPPGLASDRLRGVRRRGKAGEAPRPVLFVLPGIMGSHLRVGDDRVWLDLDDLALGAMRKLAIERPDVAPDALIARSYLDLIVHLETSYEVRPFPYDWRRSLRGEGRRLADAVAAALAESEQPVFLLAHSMGGLLARAMIAQRPEIWQRLTARRGRLVMLGTPNRGSHVIPRVLAGRERVLRFLALIDLRHRRSRLQRWIAAFPGLLELLPAAEREREHEEADAHDYFSPATWAELRAADQQLAAPSPQDLEAAGSFATMLENAPATIDPEHMVYVAGQAPATPIRMRAEARGGRGKRRLVFDATRRGDGRVSWRTGLLDGVTTYYMPGVAHGELANHRPCFPAIEELVRTGGTRQLPQTPPVSRGLSEVFTLDDDDREARSEVVMYPDRAELESAAMGSAPAPDRPRTLGTVRLRVQHGNLAFCRDPVAVGHYADSAIVHAERALDHHLGGRLSKRYALGLYPGPPRTAEALLAEPGKRPGGAVVIGLGQVGTLTPGVLADSYARGALAYAARGGEVAARERRPEVGSLRLASLLVGSGEGGLSMTDSLSAMLQGVCAANRRLATSAEHRGLRIGELILVELYEDRAIEACHTLRDLVRDPRLAEDGRPLFELVAQLEVSRGGHRRVFSGDDPSWWRRVEIVSDRAAGRADALLEHWWRRQRTADDPAVRKAAEQLAGRFTSAGEGNLTPLAFTTLSGGARAEVMSLDVDRRWADRLVEQAVAQPTADPGLGATLFELLLPNALKSRAPDDRGTVLLVDPEAARYPWEMMVDATRGEENAPALRGGIIRQLATGRYRSDVETVTAARAFVVGDPLNHDPALPALPAAQREASEVARQLRAAGYQVVERIRPQPRAVLAPLVPPGFRILHLAGHGELDRDHPERSGLLLDDGLVLSPAVIAQMRPVPELVFINCCHLGAIGAEIVPGRPDRHRLAANLGMQFIEIGSQAVVAAGWAVEDEAARVFAHTLYQRLLDGKSFGEAVTISRNAIYGGKHAGINTWSAYQCYGDPFFRLVRTRGRSRRPQTVASEAEALAALDNLEADASTAWGQRLDHLRARLAVWVKALGARRERPAVLAARARVHAALRDYEAAVGCLRQALAGGEGVLSVTDLETLVNLGCRLGVERVEHGRQQRRSAAAENNPAQRKAAEEAGRALERQGRKDVKESIALAERLLTLAPDPGGPSSEQLALLASGHKRRALISTGAVRKRALRAMTEAYHRSLERSRADAGEGGEVDTYPLLQWLTGRILLGETPEQLADLPAAVATARAIGARRRLASSDFWSALVEFDALLVKHLFDRDLADHAPRLAAEVLDVWQPGGTPREIASVLENLDVLVALLPGDPATGGGLLTIRETLRQALAR